MKQEKKKLILLNIWKLSIGPSNMLQSIAQEVLASAKYTRLATPSQLFHLLFKGILSQFWNLLNKYA